MRSECNKLLKKGVNDQAWQDRKDDTLRIVHESEIWPYY